MSRSLALPRSPPPPPPPPPAAYQPALPTPLTAGIQLALQACPQRPRFQRLTPPAAAAQDGWQSQPQASQPTTSPQQPGGAVGRFLAAFNSSPRSLEVMLACLAPDVAYHNLALAPEPFRGQQASGRTGCGREGAEQAAKCTQAASAVSQFWFLHSDAGGAPSAGFPGCLRPT